MHDPADDPAIVYPLDAAHIPRQIRPNSSPLLVAQPKQILAHDPDPFPKTNQDRILRAQKLMSFDPSPGFPLLRKPFALSELERVMAETTRICSQRRTC